ncbi:TonB-dependent receptor [Plebeiibacterium marinum]|uniref:TonB-dependent receptor n=1 Tax=Plebeiibacterium marinum TaxID=2992111 RepID=A0AAE3SKG9_9BACT|nr:TonB-dependent receptor [Plebeiobacterium marinum]MCW3806602.1 TonB-dependent receptor [Plebeiobacterium marinum]
MKTFYTIVFSMLFCISAHAGDIKGKVFEKKDKKELPLIGVNVYWSGTTIGTITDANGIFELPNNNNNQLLVFSYVGYKNDTVKINDTTPLKVMMIQGEAIDEVIVARRTASTSISKLNPLYVQKVSGKELERCACCNLSESFETNASVDVSFADAVSGVKQIQLLGLSGRYSQIAIANIPTLRGAESAFGMEYIPGTWMESIQISKGSAAVKNGYESMTGQINIQLKEPSTSERMHFYLYGNQDGKTESTFGYAFDLNEKWTTSIMLQASANYREMDMNHDGFLDKPIANMGTFINQWNYKTDNYTSKFGFSFIRENREGGQKGFNHDISQTQQSLYGINIDVERFNVFAKNGFIFKRPSTSLGTILSFNYFDRNSFYGHNTFNVTQKNFYANIIYQSYIGDTRHTYNAGFSLVHDDNDAIFNGNTDHVGFIETTPGIFAEYNYIPNEDFTFMAGIRYDHSSLHNGFITPRVHAKYNAGEHITLRASAGKGYRTPDAISENSNFLASSKSFVFDENIKQEAAWNYGIAMVNQIPIGAKKLNVNLEFYRTDFENQLVVDLDRNNNEVHFYNLDGDSYSNIFQIETSMEIFKRFDVTAAYRINDVRSTYFGKQNDVPFVNKYKGLLSGSYRTNLDKWQFDLTAQFNGKQRLPSTGNNSPQNTRANESDSYMVLMAQITKNYRNWSFYLGGENIGEYTQDNAIIDPENPFGDEFDASRVWGPLYGGMIYVGIKYNLARD